MARSRNRIDNPSPAAAPTRPSPASGGGSGRGRDEPDTRCGYVALIGAPNSGQPTLLYQLVGRKLAIVTPKVQTTRTRLLGIALAGPAQLIFVDTPGIFEPRRRLDRAVAAAGRHAILAHNKSDLVRHDARLGLADELFHSGVFAHVFMISALSGDGV